MGLPDILMAVSSDVWVYAIVAFVLGGGLTYGGLQLITKQRMAAAKLEATRIVDEAKIGAEVIAKTARVDAKEELIHKMDGLDKKNNAAREEIKEAERRVERRD